MIDMPNRPDVAMPLRPLKLRLRHLTAFSSKKTSQTKTNLNCDHRREPTGNAAGAGDGNRTHVASLEGWCSTIELHPPGAPPPAHNPPEYTRHSARPSATRRLVEEEGFDPT